MKYVLRPMTMLVSLALILNSCSTKIYDKGKMIPKNAAVIVHLNTKSLMSKVSWDDIKQTNWFKEMYNDTSVKPWTKKLLDNPAGTGIDLDAGLVIFVQKNINDDGQIVVEGDIKDAKTFEAFNKNMDASAVTTKDGDINLLTLKDKTVVGWNNKTFAYVASNPVNTGKMNFNENDVNNNVPLNNPTANLSQVCKKLFDLKTDSSMAKVDKFSALLKADGDIHIWQNTEELMKSSAQMGALSMLKLDLFLKDNISTYAVNFDKGKIDVKQKYYVSSELTDLLKKYGGGSINTDLIKNIPSQNVAGIISLHFKPEGLGELIKLTGMDGFVNMFLSKEGITLDDFVKANKGDVMFAVTDFTMKKDSFNFKDQGEKKDTSYMYDKPDASFLFSVSIGDKPSFNKLMSAGKALGGQMGENEFIHYANNDKLFAIGNSQEYVSKYIQGGNNKFDFLDKISDHPVAAFVDIQKVLLTAAARPVKDSGTKLIMDESIKTWQNLYSTGGEYKDDGFVMNTEINLVDKNTNSLKQLNGYFDRISKVMIEKNKERKQNQMDSISVNH